jgi:hypothetical protein
MLRTVCIRRHTSLTLRHNALFRYIAMSKDYAEFLVNKTINVSYIEPAILNKTNSFLVNYYL